MIQPEIQTSLRRNIRELPSKHHLSAGKNDQDLHHVSSASCCSSMQVLQLLLHVFLEYNIVTFAICLCSQVTPYACAVTPTGYTLKTSRHLLKVLNRIWNLEEQNLLNVTLIKSLKHDLDISRAQIKTLVEERKNDHQEIDELKKSTQERKNKAVQSTRDEMLDMKSSFMREKKARILLESLCDEFAKGIRDYEQKVRFLQQNRGRKDQIVCKNEPDRLILHVSEAWLDERVQMKRQFSDKTSISDDLCSEIETFLEAKKKLSQGIGVEKEDIIGKHEEIKSCGGITEPSPLLVSRMMDRGPGPAESSAHSMSRRMDRGPAVTEPTSRRAPDREEVKRNTLMAKLLEARLENQFAKSKTVRKVV